MERRVGIAAGVGLLLYSVGSRVLPLADAEQAGGNGSQRVAVGVAREANPATR